MLIWYGWSHVTIKGYENFGNFDVDGKTIKRLIFFAFSREKWCMWRRTSLWASEQQLPTEVLHQTFFITSYFSICHEKFHDFTFSKFDKFFLSFPIFKTFTKFWVFMWLKNLLDNKLIKLLVSLDIIQGITIVHIRGKGYSFFGYWLLCLGWSLLKTSFYKWHIIIKFLQYI